MSGATDQELLREYAANACEAAFAELVRRHVDLVYSVAVRLVQDHDLARDVAQSAFVALARNARSLSDRSVISPWLHLTTRNIAANTIRSDVRRRTREQEAAVMTELHAQNTDRIWEEIAPHLDDTLAALSEPDREAILLRFFERKSAREMANTLGISEEAAQKRVTRAMERLRELFGRRGIMTGGTALAAIFTANAVKAAPAGLAASVAATSIIAGKALPIALETTARTVPKLTLSKALSASAILFIAAATVYEAWQGSTLQQRITILKQHEIDATRRLDQVKTERDQLAASVAAARDENRRLNRSVGELANVRSAIFSVRARLAGGGQRETAGDRNVIETTLSAWLDRVEALKELPNRFPNQAIPELRLLSDDDWLDLAKEPVDLQANESPFGTEEKGRIAFNAARAKAKAIMMRVISRALEGYAAAHDGDLPATTSQLMPHLMNKNFAGPARIVEIPSGAIDERVLSRYEVLANGKLADVPEDATIIREKAPVDPRWDTCVKVGRNWMALGTLENYQKVEMRRAVN